MQTNAPARRPRYPRLQRRQPQTRLDTLSQSDLSSARELDLAIDVLTHAASTGTPLDERQQLADYDPKLFEQ